MRSTSLTSSTVRPAGVTMKVKVAQLITELDPGGAERIVYELATGLDPQRFEPVVISLKPATGDVARWLDEAGVRVRSVRMRSKLDFGARRRLAGLLREEGAAILNTHLIHAAIMGRRASPGSGVRALVSTVHLVERAWRKWRFWADRATMRHVDVTVCVSESARSQYLHRVRASPDHVRVIYNGIDVGRFTETRPREETRRALGFTENERVIVSLGRLRRQKGHDLALRAMAFVAAAEPRARMLVVGDGPERRRLRRLRARLKLRGHAALLGQREDVPDILAAADCLVAPSRYEGFGLAVAEGMAAGLPVIASRIDSIPEVVEDGVSGILVRPNRPQELAAKVIEILGDRERALLLGERGRARVRERFTLAKMLGSYESLYEELLRAKGLRE